MTIQLENGPRVGDLAEFDVSFQTGNTVCFCIPAERKDLLDAFKPGTQLQNMQCYAVLAVFSGSGIVSGQTRIGSGPNQGDYALDITLNAEPQLMIGGHPEPAVTKDPDSGDQASNLHETEHIIKEG